MQFIQAGRDAILKPLQAVAGIIERRPVTPILANVLLRRNGSEISFLACDSEIQIETSAPIAAAGGEISATTLSARKWLDVLRSLPEDAQVSLNLQDRRAAIRAGRSRFTLQTLDATDFPVMPVAAYSASFELTQRQLRHLFRLVHFAMAQQDVRYYLNGLLLVVDADQVTAVATDAHRLSYCRTDIPGAGNVRQEAAADEVAAVSDDAPGVVQEPEAVSLSADSGPFAESADEPAPVICSEVILPRKTVLELQRLLTDSDDPVRIDMAINQVRLRFGELELVSRIVEGKFPDYQRVIPQGYTRRIELAREVLAASLARASILTTDKFKGVRLSLSPGTLKIQTTNAEQEEAVDEIEVEYDGEPLEIGFNVAYLLDVLANIDAGTVQMAFGDSGSSALLTIPGNEDFRYVVMPMRI